MTTRSALTTRSAPTTRSARRQRAGGWTLVETGVGTAVVSLLATLAVPGMASWVGSAQIDATTTSLFTALHLARSEAILTRDRVAISPLSGSDWASGWRVYRDTDNDGRYDPDTEDVVQVYPPAPARVTVSAHFGATFSGTALSYTSDGVMRRPGSDGMVIGRLTLTHGEHVRSICAATLRLRTVRAATCS